MNDVSRETATRLARFEDALQKWSPRINLVAPRDLGILSRRHLADCLQLARFIGDGHLVDLGSGGGFPGLVVAAVHTNRSLRLTLIESDQRKAAFLRTAAREMHLHNVSVLAQRIEIAPRQVADYVTARALAPLPDLLAYVHRHLGPGGMALLMKGETWQREVDAARQMWDFDCDASPSLTDPNAMILHVTKLSPR